MTFFWFDVILEKIYRERGGGQFLTLSALASDFKRIWGKSTREACL